MNDRLTDLLARLRERFPAESTPDDVAAYLKSEGYDRRQIGEILTLFFPQLPANSGEAAVSVAAPVTIRVMGPHERGRFAPEAWGHLLSLSGSGMLSPSELEQVIDRALSQIDGRIALEDLRALMEGTGLDDAGAAGDQMTVH
jgi:Smg protein